MGLIKICAFGLGLLGTIAVWQAGGIVARNMFTDVSLAQMLFDPSFSLRVDLYRTELIMLIVMTCLSLALVVARSQAYLLDREDDVDMPTGAASLPTA